jgi:signal transduction histidine kinase
MGRVRASGERLLQTIDRILHYADIEEGALEIAVDCVSVDEAIASAFDQVRGRAFERGLDVGKVNTSTGTYVWADQPRLIEALTYLFENAVNHAGKPGSVGARVERTTLARRDATSEDGTGARKDGSRSAIAIAIWDDGPGLPNVDDSAAFAPFTRLHDVDPIAMESGNRLGLGLATAKQLARAMGGDVRIARDVDQGAEVHIMLPKADARPLG